MTPSSTPRPGSTLHLPKIKDFFFFCSTLFFYSFVPTFLLAFFRFNVPECFELDLRVKLNSTIIIPSIFLVNAGGRLTQGQSKSYMMKTIFMFAVNISERQRWGRGATQTRRQPAEVFAITDQGCEQSHNHIQSLRSFPAQLRLRSAQPIKPHGKSLEISTAGNKLNRPNGGKGTCCRALGLRHKQPLESRDLWQLFQRRAPVQSQGLLR